VLVVDEGAMVVVVVDVVVVVVVVGGVTTSNIEPVHTTIRPATVDSTLIDERSFLERLRAS